jgi:heme/copper-type cytochrome/quinol oxidase subunit 2
MSSSKTTGSIALIVMGLIFLCVGGVLGGFGVLYILAAHDAAASNPGGRLALGVGMLVAGLAIWAVAAVVAFLAWRRMQPKPEQKVTIRQEVDLTGGVELASLTCQKCAAPLDKRAVTVKEGAVFVSCPHCGATYQIVEEPKW